jgi:hypothetical protein
MEHLTEKELQVFVHWFAGGLPVLSEDEASCAVDSGRDGTAPGGVLRG